MFISKLDRQIGTRRHFVRSVDLRAPMSLLAVCLFGGTVYSQTRTDAPPPILKGGIVHQLRSLSEEAMSALRPDDLASDPPPAAHHRQQRAAAAPTQTKGRATPRRTPAAPLSERRQGAAAAKPGGSEMSLPRSDSSETAGSRTAPDDAVRSTAAERPFNFESIPTRSTGGAAPTHPTTPTQERRQVKANREASLADDWTSEVHVAESLPPVVRQSIRAKESTAPTDSNTSPRDRQESTDDELEVMPRMNGLPQGDSTQANSATVANSIPQVSRIPLPGRRPRQEVATVPTAPEEERMLNVPELPPTELPPTELPPTELPAAPGLGGQVASGGVRVPAEMVSTPTSEQKRVQQQVADSASAEPTSALLVERQPLPTPSAELLADQNALPALPELPALDAPALDAPALDLPSSARPQLPLMSLSQQAGRQQAIEPRASQERLRMETPRVQVLLNGPGDLPVGTPARYEIVVQNSDSIDLSGLLLRLDVPAGVDANPLQPSLGQMDVEKAPDGATLFTWSFAELKAGVSATAPIELLAKSARNFGVAMEWTVLPVAGSAAVDVLSPQLELVLEGPAEVNFGEPNTYRLHVRNPGSADAEEVAVKLSAEPYGASSTEIGTIKAGAEETIDVELTFHETGTINIAAQASAASDLASSTKIDVIVRRANLTATIEAPELIYHGAEVDYSVLIGNTGDAEAKDVTATLTLPQGAKLVHLPNMATLRDGKLVWPIARLKAGETFELPLQLNLNEAGENKLSIACTTPMGITTNFTAVTTVEAFADLKLLMEDPVAPAAVGSEVVYGLSLTNRGSKVANNVRVIAQFSQGIEPIRGEGSQARLAPGQLFFEPIKRIEPGQTVTLKVIAVAEKAGMHRFRAEVKADDTEQKLVQEEATQYLNRSQGRIASPPSQNVIR